MRVRGGGQRRAKRPVTRHIGILGHPGRPAVARAAARLADLLIRRGCEVRLDDRLAQAVGRPGHPIAAVAKWCDILVSLGGDGTALRGACALARRQGTLLPINLGGMGFLTVADVGEMKHAVDAALGGKWPVAQRRLVEATVTRRGRRLPRTRAMNDLVLKAAGGRAAVHLELNALGGDLGHLVADGLIAASAAGSTAYSLSAGGPVVSHDLEALVVTPVCAHALASRSLVLSGAETLTLRVLGSFDRMMLFHDGQDGPEILAGDIVKVALARDVVRLFRNPDRPLGLALRSKLGWQATARSSFG